MTGAGDWIAELRDPACYPHRPAAVAIVQTHISVVCLCDDLVFKLKKAVRLPFLDFSTLAQRRHFCTEELRLNRRLCPDVYLDVVPLYRTGAGLRFATSVPPAGGEPGELVDHAVLMRRLPADRMLDHLVREHAATADELAALARHLAAFHATADRGPAVRAAGAPERLRDAALANFSELEALRDHGLPPDLLLALRDRTRADFDGLLPVLRRRADAGAVVDGHGDLHARNICMVTPPAIYDCIEFEPAFRCGDVATEVAFLAMDLRHRGAGPLARAFVDAYAQAAGDAGLVALLPPLVRYRALVRAKVAVIAAGESELPPADRAAAAAGALRHLCLAAATAVEQEAPRWLVLCGAPAGGKSALADAIAAAAGWPCIATDRVRKELAGLPATARAGPEHYTESFSARTYAEVLRRAAAATAAGSRVVLLDGNFPSPDHRARARAAAHAAGAGAWLLHVHVDDATALRRLAGRRDDPLAVSDAGPAHFAALKARFQPPQPAEGMPVVDVDGTLPPANGAAHAFAALVCPPAGRSTGA